jgi:hypothetical protein
MVDEGAVKWTKQVVRGNRQVWKGKGGGGRVWHLNPLKFPPRRAKQMQMLPVFHSLRTPCKPVVGS